LRRGGSVAGALLGLAALAPATASADPCQHFNYGMPTGPVVAPLLDGGLGRAHRVCGRSEVALRGGGLILIDRPNFYGRVSAGLTLEGSYAPTKYTEIFAGLELLRYDTVIQSLTASQFGFGHTYVGAAHRRVIGERTSLGFNGKMVLPTAVGLYREAWPFGLDFGLSGQFAATPKVHLHGQIGLLASVAASQGNPGFRVGAAFTGGAEFLPVRRFAIAADLHSIVGYTDVLDVLAGAVALRFSGLKRFGFELAGTFPFAGRERAQAVVMLRASVRLGSITTPPRTRKRGAA
jgi:hypothetical protein